MTVNGIELDEFTQGYLECALFTNEPDDLRESGEFYQKGDWAFTSFTPEALQLAVSICAKFQADNADDLADVDLNQAGNDLWYDSAGHGVGYRDRPEIYGEGAAERLTAASERVGERYVQWDEDENHPDYGEGGGAPLIAGGHIYIS